MHLVLIWHRLKHPTETCNCSEQTNLEQEGTPDSKASPHLPTVDVTVKLKLYGLPDIEFKDILNQVSLNDLHQHLYIVSKRTTELCSLLGNMQLTGQSEDFTEDAALPWGF